MSPDPIQTPRIPAASPRRAKPRPEPDPEDRPLDIPEGATHFRLRKGGKQAPACVYTDAHGIETDSHPIEAFRANLIRARWGCDRDYWASFVRVADGKRESLGASRRFGLPDLRDGAAQEAPRAELLPPLRIQRSPARWRSS